MEEELFDFSTALLMLKNDYKITRIGWNGKGLWIEKIEGSKELNPYFVIKNSNGNTPSVWVPSTGDLFATDFSIVE